MSLSKGNKVLWSDIQAIYSQLNNCQNKFSVTQTTAPTNPGRCSPQVVSDLKNFIFALSGNKYIGTSNVAAVFNLTTPQVGELLKADPFGTMTSTLSTVYDLCTHDSVFGDNSRDSDFGNRSHRTDRSDDSRDGTQSVRSLSDGYCSGFTSRSNWTFSN